MASFAPGVQDDSVPNFTARSQGVGPNRSFETLFEGLTQTAGNVMNINDQKTQNDIQTEAESIFENTNKEFGLDVPPPGMEDSIERMTTLQNAFEQGKINDVNYYGRLATLSKQLRQKYPGYEKIVDASIQSVTGTRPANAYRDAILGMIKENQQGASDEVKAWRSYEKQYQSEIYALFGDDYFANPDKYDKRLVQAKVAGFQARKEGIAAEKNELELAKARGDFTESRAKKLMGRDLMFATDSIMTSTLKLNDSQTAQSFKDFIAKGPMDSKSTEAFIAQVSELEGRTRAELLKKVNTEYVAKGFVSPEEAHKAIDEAMYPILKAKEAVLGGNFKLAESYATINKVAQDEGLNQVLESDPRYKIGMGLEKINSELGTEYWDKNKQTLPTVGMETVGQATLGKKDAVKQVIDQGNNKASLSVINAGVLAMSDKNVSADSINQLADQFFGTGENTVKWMSDGIVSPEDREKLMMTFLSPQITKQIMEKGSDETKRKYMTWALTAPTTLTNIKAVAADLNSATAAFKPEDITMSYDPDTNRVGLKFNNRSDEKSVGYFFTTKTMQAQRLESFVNSFNNSLSVVAPIADATGVKREEVVKLMLDEMNVKLGGTLGAFKKMGDNLEVQGSGLEATPWNAATGTMDLSGVDFVNKPVNVASNGSGLDAGDMVASFAGMPKGSRASAALDDQARGSLKTSNARGYNPDVKSLRPELASAVSNLQSAWGRDLPIVSGYRDPGRNRRAGGAKRSQHMHGNAVDIDVRNLSTAERKELIKLARSQGFGGVGVYANSLHLDKGRVRSWGPSYKNASLPAWARSIL